MFYKEKAEVKKRTSIDYFSVLYLWPELFPLGPKEERNSSYFLQIRETTRD
jgi:hypothetical protein